MTNDIAGQVAIVTGAGRGIGREIGQALAARGAKVAFVARTAAEIDSARDEAVAAGGTAISVTTDVTDRAAVEAMVTQVESRLGPTAFLVNNAGVHQALGTPWEIDADDWWREIEINLKSAFLVSRFVLPGMVARRTGRIVNVSSGAAFVARPISSAYATSKAAMLRLTDSTQAALDGAGVFVFAIHPGGVQTALIDSVLKDPAGSVAYDSWRQIKKWTPPTVAANACVRIASGEFDALAGRFLDVTRDLDATLRDSTKIVARDGLTMRLRV